MKHRILSLLLVFTLLLSGLEPSIDTRAASDDRSPSIGGYEFESAVYGSGLSGSQEDLYPNAKYPYNYQYLTKNGINTYTSLWTSPEATLSFENVGDAHCTYHCFATPKAYPVADALEEASYKTMDKIITGNASFFPDITNQSFALDFSCVSEKIILDDISVDAKIYIGGIIHSFCLPDNEIIQLTNAIKNRTRYTYDAGKDIFFMNLDVKVTGAYSDYTVYTLDANGGQVTDKELIVRYNHTLEYLPVPQRTGYAFTGWFTAANGGTQVLSSHVNDCEANQTLYAHWSPKSYAVTCVDKSINGKELGTIHSTAAYDSTLYGNHFGGVTSPNTYYKGYCYSSCSNAKVIMDGCTVYRYFSPISVKVTLDPMGGSLLTKEFQAIYDMPLSLLCSPIRTGYQFNGWITKDASPVRSTDSSTFTEDTLLRASWTPNTNTCYTVEIRQKNLAGVYETVSAFQRYGTTDTTVSISPEDYVYEGFHYVPEDSLSSHNLEGDGSLLLHINYERNTHQLCFDMNPDQVTPCTGICIPPAPATLNAQYGETVLLPEPEEQMVGYTFGGWSPNPVATQAVYDAGKTLRMDDSDCTLYAVWFPKEDTRYTVYRFQQENSGEYSLLSQEILYGQTDATISYTDTQTPDGYYINRTISQLSGQILPDGSSMLIIKYDPIQYELSFLSAYDKQSKLLSRTYLCGEQITLPGEAYKRTGYIQTGWTDDKSEEAMEDATPRFQLGDTLTMEPKDLQLYPTWKSVSPSPSASPSVSADADTNLSPSPTINPDKTQPDSSHIPSISDIPSSSMPTPVPDNSLSSAAGTPVSSSTSDTVLATPSTATSSSVKQTNNNSNQSLTVPDYPIALSAKKASLGVGEKYLLTLINSKISSISYSKKYLQVKQKSVRKIQIQAIKKGTTTLSVITKEGKKLTCKITIKKAPKKIQSTKKQIHLKKGSKVQIRINVSKGSACHTYRYTSSASDIAAVSSNGQLTGKKKGTCRITVTAYNKKKTHLQVQVR